MKLLAIFLAAGLSMLAGDLSGVKAVYLLPMSGGLDQYLAVRIANAGVIQVVTDPKKADAVFTDHIGANFEQSMQDMYAEKKKPDTKSDTKSDSKLDSVDFVKPNMAPLTRGKGSLFLVDRQSHAVLWSIYAEPKTTNPAGMNDLAMKIADQLFRKDRVAKK
jgi:hypothetical protein